MPIFTGMIRYQKMDSKEFKAESAETKDADIKSFVDKSCGEIKLM